jgi:hypothetical protein
VPQWLRSGFKITGEPAKLEVLGPYKAKVYFAEPFPGWPVSLAIKQWRSYQEIIKAAEEGTYGICEMCGATISPERLEIVPETTLCVQCAAKREQTFHRWQMAAEDSFAARHRRRSGVDDDDEDDDDDDDDESTTDLDDEDDAEY